MKNTEKELKLLIKNEIDYLKLLSYFKSTISYYQHNYFYDSYDKILQKKLLALRLRTEKNNFYITLKGPKTLKNEITIREEFEAKISEEEACKVLKNEKNIIETDSLPIKILKEKMDFKTKNFLLFKYLEFKNLRTDIKFHPKNEKFLLELDKTYFENGNVNYELEVEFDDENKMSELKSELKKVFNIIGIPWQLSSESKLSKAIKYAFLKNS